MPPYQVPTKRERTQSNHCFMALYAACRLEGLRVKHRLNHFALQTLSQAPFDVPLTNYKA